MSLKIVLAILLLSTTAAHAQYVTKAAVSGKPVKLIFTNVTNPDCSAAGEVTVRVIHSPVHGRVQIAKSRDFPSFPPHNIRSDCNRRRVAGTVAHYVSQRGFTGVDRVGIEMISSTGGLRRRSFTILVR